MDRFVLGYAPSLALALQRPRAHAAAHPRVAVVSDPVYAADDRRLHGWRRQRGGNLRGPLAAFAQQAHAPALLGARGARSGKRARGDTTPSSSAASMRPPPGAAACRPAICRCCISRRTRAARSDSPEQSALYLSEYAPDGKLLPIARLTVARHHALPGCAPTWSCCRAARPATVAIARRRRARSHLRIPRQRLAFSGCGAVAHRGRVDRAVHERVLQSLSRDRARGRSAASRAAADARLRQSRGVVEFRGAGKRISVSTRAQLPIDREPKELAYAQSIFPIRVKKAGVAALAATLLLGARLRWQPIRIPTTLAGLARKSRSNLRVPTTRCRSAANSLSSSTRERQRRARLHTHRQRREGPVAHGHGTGLQRHADVTRGQRYCTLEDVKAGNAEVLAACHRLRSQDVAMSPKAAKGKSRAQ